MTQKRGKRDFFLFLEKMPQSDEKVTSMQVLATLSLCSEEEDKSHLGCSWAVCGDVAALPPTHPWKRGSYRKGALT